MGSTAYGVAEKESSDVDIYGFAIPPKSIVFPHTAGYIQGFDEAPNFEQWQQHHVPFPAKKEVEYDFSVFSIVKYFKLLYDNNPNIIDSLFVPEFCIKHITTVGQLVRDERRIFLSKRCWTKFRGYAASQFHKLENKNPEGKRKDLVEKFGYDTKFAYHIIRLLGEAEQILLTKNLRLDKNNEELKAIRRGEWTYERLCKEFESRKISVENSFVKSELPDEPDKEKIKNLLVRCLKIHYGNLEEVLPSQELPINVLRKINKDIETVRHLL
jgi:predicted nucleotidyltransferase